MSGALTLQASGKTSFIGTAAKLAQEVTELFKEVPYVKGVAGIVLRIIEIKEQCRENLDRQRELMDQVGMVAVTIFEGLKKVKRSWHEDDHHMLELKKDLEVFYGVLVDVHTACASLVGNQDGWKSQSHTVWNREEILATLDRLNRRLGAVQLLFCTNRLISSAINVAEINATLKDIEADAVRKSRILAAMSRDISNASTASSDTLVGIERVEKTIQRLDGSAIVLNEGVQGLQGGLLNVSRGFDDMRQDMQDRNEENLRSEILAWLDAANVASNHTAALASRKGCEDSGKWFIESSAYKGWLEKPGPLLWIKGKIGSGKTVLCSIVLENLLGKQVQKDGMAVAYFYVDLETEEKRTRSGLISALLSQLLQQSTMIPHALRSLYANRRPISHNSDPLVALRDVLRTFNGVFIVIDSPDGCLAKELRGVLNLICFLNDEPNVHLMVACRPEGDFRDTLQKIALPCDELHRCPGNRDIVTFIDKAIENANFRKWSEVDREHIRTRLVDEAGGMFRWVACQISVLEQCMTPKQLKRALGALPRSLDETYGRILEAIPDSHVAYARNMLLFLAFAYRPLRVEEIVDFLAMTEDYDEHDEDHLPTFDRDNKLQLQDPSEILRLCPNLVTESFTANHVSLAHSSVKDYLLTRAPSIFRITERQADRTITAVCLGYLAQFSELHPHTHLQEIVQQYPLALYASLFWTKHAGGNASGASSAMKQGILDLLKPDNRAAIAWAKLNVGGRPYHPASSPYLPPIYHAVVKLDEHCAVVDDFLQNSRADKNILLRVAVVDGATSLVKRLLDSGADVNAAPDEMGSALVAAVSVSGPTMIALLLDNMGTDVNAHDGECGGPLQAAAFRGELPIIDLLLSRGASINATDDVFGTALQAAARKGDDAVMAMLLERGAKVDTEGGLYGTVLQTAAYQGSEDVVRLLLQPAYGVNVNGVAGKYGTALQAAARRGSLSLVRMLLQHGANPNTRGGRYGTALHAAAYAGPTPRSVARLKLAELQRRFLVDSWDSDKGVLVCRTLLQKEGPGAEAFQLLVQGSELERSGYAFVRGPHYMARISAFDHDVTSLVRQQLAVWRERGAPSILDDEGDAEEIARTLLRVGADANALGEFFGSPLYAAVAGKRVSICHILLDAGADPNAICGSFATALHAAAYHGSLAIVQLLLRRDAAADLQHGRLESVLRDACRGGKKHPSPERDSVVRFLASLGDEQRPLLAPPTMPIGTS